MFDTMSEAIASFDDSLNETHDELFGHAPAYILRKVDPIVYREGFHDWLDVQGIDIDSLEDDEDLP